MANTPTSILRLILQEEFKNTHTWGGNLNSGLIMRLDEAFGTLDLVVSADITLTALDFLQDQARAMALNLSGAGGFTVWTPQGVPKPYFVRNACSSAVTVRPLSGTGVSIPAGTDGWVTFNAAGSTAYFTSGFSSRSGAHANAFSKQIKNAAAGTTSTDVATLGNRLDQFAKPTSSVDANAQKVINLASGTAPTDAVNVSQVAPLVEPYALAAAGSASAAAGSAGAAAGSAGSAAGSASAASSSAVLSSQWAQNPENTPVVTGAYSALHWAAKAAASAAAAQTWDPSNYYTKTEIDTLHAKARADAFWLASVM